jgi:ESX secretion system protein EccE
MARSVALQVVAVELAAVLVVTGLATSAGWSVAALVAASLLGVLAIARLRRRWAYQWVGHGSRYLRRCRVLHPGGDAAALLDLVRPAAAVASMELDGASVGIVVDVTGLTALVEVGDTGAVLGGAHAPVPALTALLPAIVADQPGVRLQLIIAGVAAPAMRTDGSASATSYRQLTEGRLLAQRRVLIAAHARRAGGFGEADLRRSLASAVRRVRRRLDRDRLPCRPLAADTVLRVLAELAHHDPAQPVRESWTGIDVGGLRQVSFRLSRWPRSPVLRPDGLLSHLLTLPCSGTTVSLTVERSSNDIRAELIVRLAAPSNAGLGNAVAALRRLLDSTSAAVERLDGAQLDGLAASLPLGGAGGPDVALWGLVAGRDTLTVAGATPARVSAGVLDALEPTVGGEGLMLGMNRKGEPVVVRLFRPEPTRAALVGGLRCAQTLILRALAIGAQVVLQSGRPYAWEPFLRGLCGEQVTLVVPGWIDELRPATPMRPQLLVVDVGPLGATGAVVESPWRATLLVRDELTAADVDVLASADLALLQPLGPQEAALAAAALGLGESAGWLTRIRGDMLGVMVGRRTLRWALLSSTPIEQQLIGAVTRTGGGGPC